LTSTKGFSIHCSRCVWKNQRFVTQALFANLIFYFLFTTLFAWQNLKSAPRINSKLLSHVALAARFVAYASGDFSSGKRFETKNIFSLAIFLQ